jgi:hypothetical protein
VCKYGIPFNIEQKKEGGRKLIREAKNIVRFYFTFCLAYEHMRKQDAVTCVNWFTAVGVASKVGNAD